MEEGYKKGRRHPGDRTQRLKKRPFIIRLKEYPGRFLQAPPSNLLQKVSIYITIVFTLITGYLAMMTYNTTTQIQGMEQVLKTFNANVRWTPKSYTFSNDTILFKGIVKNFGTRVGTNITVQSYLLVGTGVYELDPQDAVADLLPLEDFQYEFIFPGTIVREINKISPEFYVASKVKFFDPVTNREDSNYSFTSTYSKLSPGKLAIANREETDKIKLIIKSMNSDFIP